uniref:B-cell receptor CD22 n=1 Tax=Esox lucius TaxID=8010 RepID=A0A3P9ADR9_ESOLU
MALMKAGGVLLDFLLSVAMVLGQNGWSVTYSPQRIFALKGSTVNLSCSYTFPSDLKVLKTLWFTTWASGAPEPKDVTDDSTYAGRVTYHGGKMNVHTLTITDLRESDYAVYMFRFITDKEKYSGTPGVTLSSTDFWSVTYSAKSVYAMKGSTVEMSCSYTFPRGTVTSTFWFRKGANKNPVNLSDDPDYRGRVMYRSDEKNRHTLIITDLRETDSAEYKFRFITDQTGGKYTGLPGVNLILGWSVKYTAESICALKGSTVELSCSYTFPSGTVTSAFWFAKYDTDKNPVNLRDDPNYTGRVTYRNDTKNNHILNITDLRESDSTFYWFRFTTNLTRGKFTGEPGVSLSVTGLQVAVTPDARPQKTLTCGTTCALPDNPTYIWYKNGHPVKEDRLPAFSVSSGAEDCYACVVKGYEQIRSTVAYGPKNMSVSVSTGVIVEGSSVTLTCSSDANPPVDKYTWYKKTVTSPKASGQSYSITNITSEDSGEYYCEAENGIGSKKSTALMINFERKHISAMTVTLITSVGLVVLLLSFGFVCFWKKASKSSSPMADAGQGGSMYLNVPRKAVPPATARRADTADGGQVGLFETEDRCDNLGRFVERFPTSSVPSVSIRRILLMQTSQTSQRQWTLLQTGQQRPQMTRRRSLCMQMSPTWP